MTRRHRDDGLGEERPPGPLARFFAGVTLREILIVLGGLGLLGGVEAKRAVDDSEDQVVQSARDSTVAYLWDRTDSIVVALAAKGPPLKRLDRRVGVLEDKVFKGKTPALAPERRVRVIPIRKQPRKRFFGLF